MGVGTIGIAGKTDDLRACLRAATSPAHDQLDSAMRRASGWSDVGQYGRFLSLQYAARRPVETWLAENSRGGKAPPPQTGLIAQDLAALDLQPGDPAGEFDLDGSDDGVALGAAWVLAGSSLGNRMILKQIRKAGRSDWPGAFLGDQQMIDYWSTLRASIERPASLDEISAATLGANAVFDHFLANVQPEGAGGSLARSEPS